MIVLFLVFIVNGEPQVLDGWHPISVSTMERCLAAKEVLDFQIPLMTELPYVSQCVEVKL